MLAREDVGTNVYEDRLIGVFITTEFLDLFDVDSFLSGNVGDFRDGEVAKDGSSQAYQGRLYATQVTKTLIDEETGDVMQAVDFIFEGIEGISFFSPTVLNTSEFEGNTNFMTADDAISNVQFGIHVGDDINSSTMNGTIFISQHNLDKVFYFNPVYQSTDGSVYVQSGSSISASGVSSEGVMMTQTLEVTTTITENGKSKTDSMSISISISVMFAPEKIIILQMDADNSLISRLEYEPDAMPETLALEKDTEYFIVETHSRDNEGLLNISREIYGSNTESIETFFVRADGFCVMHWTQIMRE
jgi:hypothetical protein